MTCTGGWNLPGRDGSVIGKRVAVIVRARLPFSRMNATRPGGRRSADGPKAVRRTLVAVVAVAAAVGLAGPQPAGAQSPSGDWSAPLMLYRSDLSVSWPIVVTDAYGTVHVFWVEGSSEYTPSNLPSVIFHTENDNGRWSKPSDILLSPGNGSAEAPEVAADAFGGLHMIWHGPNNTLYYSSVDARKAAEAGAWSTPKAIATSLLHTGIFVDAKGGIHVVYPNANNFGVSYTYSSDGGGSWSSGTTVALPYQGNSAADYAQVAVDSAGNIHVVWTEFQLPNAWPPLGVFYARSTDGGKTWSPALRFAGQGYDVATIKVDSENRVHADWNGMITVGGRYYVQSRDSGKTWSKPVAVIPAKIGGTSGYSDLAIDSAGHVHMASAASVHRGTGEFASMVYSAPENGVWSPRVGLSGDLQGTRVQSVEWPRIAVSDGNRLNVVFEVGYEEVYYVTRLTDAPEVKSSPAALAPVAATQPPATASAKPAPSIGTQTATPGRAGPTGDAVVPPGSDSPVPLLLALVPAALLVAAVMLARLSGRGI